MIHKAKKAVIITEKLILDDVIKIIEEAGARGYTVVAAAGKGDRGVRSGVDSGLDVFTNVKIEVVARREEVARKIADKVSERFFDHYAGIIYLEDVEILRPEKFEKR